MNTQRLLRRIKRKISAYQIALPIENLDQFIVEILEDTTIPVFSIYQPRYQFISCYTNEFYSAANDRADMSELYILPDYLFEGRELLFVRRVEYANDGSTEHHIAHTNGLASLGASSLAGGGAGAIIESMLLANANKPLADILVDPVTFHFTYPNKLYIYDSLLSSRLRLTLACEHDSSMVSIPPTAAESFYQLAILDIMDALYQIVKHYDGKGGIHDTQEFKIQDWENAANERRDLLKEWDDVFMLDQGSFDFG